jgi:hypothetical protein
MTCSLATRRCSSSARIVGIDAPIDPTTVPFRSRMAAATQVTPERNSSRSIATPSRRTERNSATSASSRSVLVLMSSGCCASKMEPGCRTLHNCYVTERAQTTRCRQVDPGWLHISSNSIRLKIGKTIDPKRRMRAARTWLPEFIIHAGADNVVLEVIGCKRQ